MGAVPSQGVVPLESGKRAGAILAAHLGAIRRRADLLFGILLTLLWITAALSSWVAGSDIAVVAAVSLACGTLFTVVPVGAVLLYRGSRFTRHLITAALMLWSALFVQLTAGRLESHFLVFGALALLAWYRDWRVLVTAAGTVLLGRLAVGLLFSSFAVTPSEHLWRALEHLTWVVLESVFLYFAISESLKHLLQIARHQAELEVDRQKARSEVLRQTERLYVKEEELRQAQKMEAVGRLAGGIAHDFNNLLTVITGYSEALLCNQEPGDGTYQGLVEIQKAAERAALLTRQLVAFSRKQILAPKSLDLNAVITDMEKLLRRLIGEDVELVTRLRPRLGKVYADPGQLQQVVMNLAINARDAMPEGGTLVIETGSINFGGGLCVTGGDQIPAGPYLTLTIVDTGLGMDEATQARIFEPFFTTKEPGKGTGLGLATVYGIVRQSGGFIQVISSPGCGTSFKICLPRTFDAVETLPEDTLASATLRGCGTILLVEDEDSVRKLARTILQAHGYQVIEANNGREGLTLAQQHQDKLDMVLSDMVMPQMSGRQLAEQLRTLMPAVKVMLMSGYTDDSLLRQGLQEEEEVHFLQKPFSPRELLAKVRELMQATATW